MRTTHAMRNVVSSIILGGLVVLMQFVLQWALARTMGAEYLGINSLFVTTIALLAVAELGFGPAIVQQLYEPLKRRDWARVAVLMRFYRTIYRVVAGLVLTLGVLIVPFLDTIVGDNQLDSSIYIIFGLFLFNSVISYLLSYKRSLLQADQRGYTIDIFYTATYLAVSAVQIIVLFMTHDYYLFLVGNIVFTIICNVLINRKVTARYSQVDLRDADAIDSTTKAHIFKQVKGLVYHKLASFIVPSSSNLIISILLGLKSVGLASNYLLVSNAITAMTWKVSGAITASVGNLLVDASSDKLYRVYKNLQFGAMSLGAVVATVYLVCVDRFIRVWVGDEYVLGWGMALVFACVIYLTVMRIVPNSFKQAAGIFYEDRYMPVIEAAINLVVGLAGALLFGLEGVFWGLAVSTLFIHLYAYPKYVYRRILQQPPFRYITDMLPYLIATVFATGLVWFGAPLVAVDSWIGLVGVGLMAVAIVLIVFYIMFGRSEEWRYYVELTRGLISKRRS